MAIRPRNQALPIRAAVLRSRGGPLLIEPLLLEGPRDDEVLLRIVSSGICRTDIDLIDGWSESLGPCVLGHEGAAIVQTVGKGVTGVTVGDHVVLSFQSCGFCKQCSQRRPAACAHFGQLNFGFERMDGSNSLQQSGVRGHFFGQSSFATHIVTNMRNVVKVPQELDLNLLAPLGCGVQTGAGTILNSLKVAKGAGITILGTGSVGLAAVMAARLVGADPIIGIDIRPNRLKVAEALGATNVVSGRSRDLLSSIKRITGRGVDYVVETTGSSDMITAGLAALNPGGIAALLATVGGSQVLSEGRRAMSVVQGDAVPQQFIPRLIDLYQSGAFPFDRLVTFYDFSEINRAIADSEKGVAIKPVLRIGED